MNIFDKIVLTENDAASFGFKWETAQQIKEQIVSEIAEVDAHLEDKDQVKLQEEIGDLLHAVFSLTVYCGLNPEATLSRSVEKFERRLHAVKQLATQDGLSTLNGKSFRELMEYWARAKKINDGQ
jgi:uncharacterized protein YabN with tetrapyrrole methylase and pyrophosphatase domain